MLLHRRYEPNNHYHRHHHHHHHLRPPLCYFFLFFNVIPIVDDSGVFVECWIIYTGIDTTKKIEFCLKYSNIFFNECFCVCVKWAKFDRSRCALVFVVSSLLGLFHIHTHNIDKSDTPLCTHTHTHTDRNGKKKQQKRTKR